MPTRVLLQLRYSFLHAGTAVRDGEQHHGVVWHDVARCGSCHNAAAGWRRQRLGVMSPHVTQRLQAGKGGGRAC